jgi:GNAT superfamily N-acetyltransferase
VDVVHVRNDELRAQCVALVHATPEFEDLDCSGEVWAVLGKDGSLIATAGAVLDTDIRDVRFTFCVVRPEQRGTGVQQKLIRARTWWAKRQGAMSLQTYAHKDNVASLISLLKCGFAIVDYDGEFVTVGHPL